MYIDPTTHTSSLCRICQCIITSPYVFFSSWQTRVMLTSRRLCQNLHCVIFLGTTIALKETQKLSRAADLVIIWCPSKFFKCLFRFSRGDSLDDIQTSETISQLEASICSRWHPVLWPDPRSHRLCLQIHVPVQICVPAGYRWAHTASICQQVDVRKRFLNEIFDFWWIVL